MEEGYPITWQEKWSVHNSEFDDQHKMLFVLMNKLGIAIEAGNDKSMQKEILDELSNYCQIHFDAEEQAMRNRNFPRYSTHKNLHDHFVNRVAGFEHALRNNELNTHEVLHFLRSWLVTHIESVDQQYAQFFAKQDDNRPQ